MAGTAQGGGTENVLNIPPGKLLELANRWEPEASSSPPVFRAATCVQCGEPMAEMWHVWLKDGGFKKEIHLCWDCGLPWMT